MGEQYYHCYLFEAKSIQSYLFRSGKLKEIISSSERLDSLVDDRDSSPLFKTLEQLGVESNLLSPDSEPQNNQVPFIYFTRCKAGALFCYCNNHDVIQSFRSLWTLTVSQLFPSLEFVDAIANDTSLPEAVDKAREALTADRNQPSRKLPYATPVMALCQRTGSIAHPLTDNVRHEQKQDNAPAYMNWDSILHLEAHSSKKNSDSNRLQEKYTPNNTSPLRFPIDLDKEFPFIDGNNRDIALIHIDGNGMGILVQTLQQSLKKFMQESSLSRLEKERVYRQVLRQFSSALCHATQAAAKDATKRLIERISDNYAFLPLRPLVLGGDDVTCLVRSDLAVDYALDFCKSFRSHTKNELDVIKSYCEKIKHFDISKLPSELTASGGIVFQKSGQPFVTANLFAEKLCKFAKELTKNELHKKQQTQHINDNQNNTIGPAALAYHKLSSVMAADVDATLAQVQSCKFKGCEIHTGMYRFLVEPSSGNAADFEQLKSLYTSTCAPKHHYPITAGKWRKLLGHLSQTETDNLSRTLALYEKHANTEYMTELKQKFATFGHTSENEWWYWAHPEQKGALQTVIGDLIILERYWFSSNHNEEQLKCN